MRILLVVLSFAASAAFAKERAVHSPSKAECEARVKNVIIKTAEMMGAKSKIGVKLFSSPSGLDSANEPLTKYHSGVFLVKHGYLSDSGADVVVRAKTCEVVKMSISVGG